MPEPYNYWTTDAGPALEPGRCTDGADGAQTWKLDEVDPTTGVQRYRVVVDHYPANGKRVQRKVTTDAEAFKSLIESGLTTLMQDPDVKGTLRQSLQVMGLMARLVHAGRAAEGLEAMRQLVTDPEIRDLFHDDLFTDEDH